MRTTILSFLLLSLSTLGITQSSSDYCVCDEEIPGYNYFITDDQTTGNLVPDLTNEVLNFSETWVVPPSFYAPPRTVVPTDFPPVGTPKENNSPDNLDGIFSPITSSNEPIPPNVEIALENNSTPEISAEDLQESESQKENVTSSAGGAPTQRNRNVKSNKRKVVWTKRSSSVKNRIKRKKRQGRLKNKRKGQFKKYKGKCPYFGS